MLSVVLLDAARWNSLVGNTQEVPGRITSPGQRADVSTHVCHQPAQTTTTPRRYHTHSLTHSLLHHAGTTLTHWLIHQLEWLHLANYWRAVCCCFIVDPKPDWVNWTVPVEECCVCLCVDVTPSAVHVGNIIQGMRLSSAQGRDIGLLDHDVTDTTNKVRWLLTNVLSHRAVVSSCPVMFSLYWFYRNQPAHLRE